MSSQFIPQKPPLPQPQPQQNQISSQFWYNDNDILAKTSEAPSVDLFTSTDLIGDANKEEKSEVTQS